METRVITLSMGCCNWGSCLVTATPTARGVNHLAPPVATSVRENTSPKDDGWLSLIVYSRRTKKPSSSSQVHVKMTHCRLYYTAALRTDISSSRRFDSRPHMLYNIVLTTMELHHCDLYRSPTTANRLRRYHRGQTLGFLYTAS